MTKVLTRAAPARLWRLAVLSACCVAGLAPALVSPPPSDTVSFEVTATRAIAGRTRVIAFHAPKSDADRALEAAVSDDSVLSIVDKPTIQAGYDTGYLRLRALKPGTATLTVGATTINIDVVPPSRMSQAPVVSIAEPASGASVWGRLAVGVEVDESMLDAPLSPDATIELRLSTGQSVKPTAITPRSLGPVRRVLFDLDTAEVPAGPLTMWVAGPDLGADSGQNSPTAIRVRVIKPAESAVTKIEAEEPFIGTRPDRFKNPKLSIQNDKNASGGKFVSNASSEPAICIAFHVDEPGWYQAFLTAAADFGGGAYPSVGLIVDGAQYPVTNARLCASAWHRLPLGVPFKLNEGDRVLTPYFLNDFAAGRLSDRNLRLDYIELARVEPGALSAPAGNSMMSDQAMASQPASPSMTDQAAPMTSMVAMAESMQGTDDTGGLQPSSLRIALSRVLDGQVLGGDLDIDGTCWFERMEANPPGAPPRVALVVNGEVVSEQWAAAPHFLLDAAHLKPGQNTIQLTAQLASGAKAATPIQKLTWDVPSGTPTHAPKQRFERFTVFDPRWDADIRPRIQRVQGNKERTAAIFNSNATATLNVPEDLTGSFDLLLELMGQDFKGPAVATVRLKYAGEDPVLIKELPAPARWDTRKVATIDLRPGPKQITVSFENDKYEEGVGDTNLNIQSVTLATPTAAPSEDKTAPSTAILYPSNGAPCYMQDVIIAQASDDRSLASLELLIDAQPTGIRADLARAPGRALLPLLLRAVPPGEHQLSIKALDAAKNESTSKPVTINVLASAPATLGPYQRALRLLDRFAFGPDTDALTAILTKGESRWLEDALSAPFDDTPDATAYQAALTRYPTTRGGGEVQRRVVLHALTTPNPARARFVLWTENHFSTWIRKTEGDRKWAEHVAFSRLGAAPFGDLLAASARSPAMLRYLDQENSYATRLNENYAREIMELHCLGVHAGYTQQDVTSLAHLLTGWTVSREGDGRSGGESSEYNFRFDPSLNDRAEIKVVGCTFPSVDKAGAYDRTERALEVLAAHPATASFIAKKLADHYLGCPAPDAVVSDLATVFRATNGDMKELLLALSRHPAFWATDPGADVPAPRLAHPQDFGIRLARVARHINANQVSDFLSRSGQALFDRATPDGYSELDSDYTDSNAMIQRWRLAQDFGADLVQLIPEPWRRDDAVRVVGPPTPGAPAPTAPLFTSEDGWSQSVVDILAIRLTGRILSPQSNDAALKMLADLQGKRPERLQKFAPLIAQLPEAHLR